ncbi:hypothetical protein GWH51_002080, partial [Neisseria gonorrhoeae]
EEKRREEKRREGFLRAGFIFGSLYRFDRLKKKIFTDVERRIISGSGRCFNTIWRMNKNKDRRASFRRHSRAGGNLGRSVRKLIGKKGFLRFYVLDSHFCGNDVVQVSVRMDSSFPRRRESGPFGFSYFR